MNSYVHNMPKKMRVLTELHIIITLKLARKPEWSIDYEDEYKHVSYYKWIHDEIMQHDRPILWFGVVFLLFIL